MTPCLLALDTSTDLLAAGLLTPAGTHCINQAGGVLASTRLIPALLQLLDQGGVGFADLRAIAFGQGPGAFTGLRTACAVAQGLAFAHNTPVLAIDSLLIVAEDARLQSVRVLSAGATHPATHPANHPGADQPANLPADWWVVMDARMGEAYAAAYHWHGAGWQVQVAPQLWTLAALAQTWLAQPPQRVAGSGVTAFADALPWANAQRWPQGANRASALLRLASAAWDQGQAIAADQALPLYLRDKVAQTSAERLAQRAANAVPVAA